MFKKLIILLLVCIFAVNVDAAVIHGTVYNLYLDVLNGAIVQINTEPEQLFVARNGEYSFNVPKGSYKITARYSNEEEFYTEENLTVKGEGDYVLDLILMPSLEEEEILGEEIDLDEEEPKVNSWLIAFIILINLFVVIYLITWFRRKHPVSKEEGEVTGDLDSLVNFIKDQDGRTTQKDIRKRFNLSEAKISLMITELEHKNIIEKIKKGRGNIIILKK